MARMMLHRWVTNVYDFLRISHRVKDEDTMEGRIVCKWRFEKEKESG
jgi:hypothetical protein